MKKILSKFIVVLGILALGAGGSLSAWAGVFPDVPEDHEYFNAIEYLKGKDYIGGYGDLTFKPDKEINRAEAVKIIVSALEIPHGDDYLVLFGDVPDSEWFFEFVMGAYEAGIVSGDSNGKFRPEDPINLAESLKIIAEAFGVDVPAVAGDAAVFADVSADAWYADYALYAKNKNILMMDDYGEVNAGDPMTRGRFAEIMYRFMRVNESGGEPFPIDENWEVYDSGLLPFKVKKPDGWDVLNLDGALDEVVIWNSDKNYYQFSPERVYPNTSKFVVTLDANASGLSENEYFSNIKMVFGTGKAVEFALGTFNVLKVYYTDRFIEDWYIYLNSGPLSGQVLVIYTQNGTGVLAEQNRKFLDLMLASFEYDEGSASASSGVDYSDLKDQIFENILIEGVGLQMINSMPDSIIFETDSIGVGTGPIDYYYSSELDITLKYERAGDVILDYRDGQTSAF